MAIDHVKITKLQKEKEAADSVVQKLRVAAYCRVSTDQEEQRGSLKEQIRAYKELIAKKDDWTLAGVYADEGVTGTSVSRRREFMRMIKDCERGKVDLIVTKSISRFARNTLECLTYVRRLADMGVNVVFENNNIDTRDSCSEMLLTVLAAFAQEERRSISENTIWGIRKRYEAGIPRWSRLLGYAKVDGKDHQIVPDEAEVVRLVFDLYEHGSSYAEIIRELERRQIPSPRGRARWGRSSILSTLSNERYMGDLVLQKYRVENHITHKRRRNDNLDVPSWRLENHHQALVSRKQFARVQEIRTMRLNTRRSGTLEVNQYPFGAKLVCPHCGASLYRRPSFIVPRMANVLHCERGDAPCGRFFVRTSDLEQALLDAYAKLDVDSVETQTKRDEYADAARTTLEVKEKSPLFKRVDYWWIDELIDRFAFADCWDFLSDAPPKEYEIESPLTIYWRCGIVTKIDVKTVWALNPKIVRDVASLRMGERYENYAYS